MRGFIRNLRIPMASAFSSLILSLNPVQRMMRISDRIFMNSFASASPVMRGIIKSVITRSIFWGSALKISRASVLLVLEITS